MEPRITLEPVRDGELPEFERKIQEAFLVSVEEDFGRQEEPIPSHRDLEESIRSPGAVVFHLMQGSCKVGGIILNINSVTQHNLLDFFFIAVEYQNRGLGQAAWRAVEEAYPETKVWSTATPYFEKRNIHFYVNRCGFKIVAFWNALYPDPHMSRSQEETELPAGCEEMFYFEKVMNENRIQ